MKSPASLGLTARRQDCARAWLARVSTQAQRWQESQFDPKMGQRDNSPTQSLSLQESDKFNGVQLKPNVKTNILDRQGLRRAVIGHDWLSFNGWSIAAFVRARESSA